MGKKKTKDSKISAPAPVARAKAKAKEAPATAADVAFVEGVGLAVVKDAEAPEAIETVEAVEEPQGNSQYSALVPLLHRLLDTVETKTAIPAIHETCSCGADVTLAESVPEADRKRIHNAWVRRHKPCTEGAVAEAPAE